MVVVDRAESRRLIRLSLEDHSHHKWPEKHNAGVQATPEANRREDAQHEPPERLIRPELGRI